MSHVADRDPCDGAAHAATNMTIKLSIDCMGGDHGPSVTVPASVAFLHSEPSAELILVGRVAAVRAELDKLGVPEIWNTRITKVKQEGMESIVESVLERWFTADFLSHAPAQVERVRKMLQETSAEGYIANCAAVRDMDQRSQIASITTPTLVIAGRHDKATPPEHGELISRAIKGSRYVELNAAHLSNWEVAQAFTQTLLDFLLNKPAGH